MGDRLRAGIPSRAVTSQLCQLSFASLRDRLVEYQLRLGWRREYHSACVIPYGTWVPVAVRLLANCYTPFTFTFYSVLPMPTASWYRPSNCQQSAAEPLRLRFHTSGIHCQSTANWRRCGKFTVHLLSTVKTFFTQAIIISWHHPVSGPCSGCAT